MSFSIASLCLFRVWTEAPPFANTAYLSHTRVPPLGAYYSALCLNLAILTIFFMVIRCWPQWNPARWTKWLSDAILGFFLLLSLSSIRIAYSAQVKFLSLSYSIDRWGGLVTLSLVFTLLVFCLFAVIRAANQVRRLLRYVLVALAPFAIWNTWDALHCAGTSSADQWKDPPSRGFLPASTSAKRRVVLIVFDEWDYRLSFPDRRNGLQLPAIDRFRNGSLHATQAQPPGTNTTSSFMSILRDDRSQPPEALVETTLTPPGRPPNEDKHSLFAKLARNHLNAGVVSWYVPLCRIYGANLSACEWHPYDLVNPLYTNSTSEAMKAQLWDLASPGVLTGWLPTPRASRHIETLKRLQSAAVSMTSDPRLSFAMVHLPTTHQPFVWDAAKRRISVRSPSLSSYLDSVTLVDQQFDEIRRSMEQVGVWTSSTVILTADHSQRTKTIAGGAKDARVPFLVKMAGSTSGRIYERPINTVAAHELTLKALDGTVATQEDLVRFLNAY
ncbi:MAG: sulfatase-like hydrolase/transferase [Acidobacteria bacterium]|nr:sulfatase-like hydrolase/transferase [Acidobacteriota bacterium]